MSNWDQDSPQLRSNLHRVLSDVRRDALQRVKPTVAAARKWQADTMQHLIPPKPEYVGRFRGEPGLEGCEVEVGSHPGVSSVDVADALKSFERKLQETVDALDELIEPGQDLSADHVAAVIELCAWVHSDWIRIHPFANGNGRTARTLGQLHRHTVWPAAFRAPAAEAGRWVWCRRCRGDDRSLAIDGTGFRRMYRDAIRGL